MMMDQWSLVMMMTGVRDNMSAVYHYRKVPRPWSDIKAVR
jgi:hypothetical protein